MKSAMKNIDLASSVFEEANVFEFEDMLYEDLRPCLSFDWNKDLVDEGINFRVIFDYDDYDYIVDKKLDEKLCKFKQ